MRILVTGGAGFIGSEFVRQTLSRYPTDEVTVLDKLTYAGNLDSLRVVSQDPRYKFLKADICDEAAIRRLFHELRPDAVLHLAAESHVDRSISGSRSFIDTNILWYPHNAGRGASLLVHPGRSGKGKIPLPASLNRRSLRFARNPCPFHRVNSV